MSRTKKKLWNNYNKKKKSWNSKKSKNKNVRNITAKSEYYLFKKSIKNELKNIEMDTKINLLLLQ